MHLLELKIIVQEHTAILAIKTVRLLVPTVQARQEDLAVAEDIVVEIPVVAVVEDYQVAEVMVVEDHLEVVEEDN